MDIYGLIGYPLGHSFSRNYFNQRFHDEKTDAEYLNFEIPTIKDFPTILAQYPDLKGLNVTIPYKEAVIPYLDGLSDDAKAIGAVNVIKVRFNNGKTFLTGYNSDVIGFSDSLEPLLEKQHTKALVLGTGGASKAVVYGLKKLGIEPLQVSRSEHPGMIQYKDITLDMMEQYYLIVNCTPVGMYPHVNECPDLPYGALTKRHLLYDLIYNPDETLFLKKGAEKGAKTKNGLEMLLLQAFASWRFWHEGE